MMGVLVDIEWQVWFLRNTTLCNKSVIASVDYSGTKAKRSCRL